MEVPGRVQRHLVLGQTRNPLCQQTREGRCRLQSGSFVWGAYTADDAVGDGHYEHRRDVVACLPLEADCGRSAISFLLLVEQDTEKYVLKCEGLQRNMLKLGVGSVGKEEKAEGKRWAQLRRGRGEHAIDRLLPLESYRHQTPDDPKKTKHTRQPRSARLLSENQPTIISKPQCLSEVRLRLSCTRKRRQKRFMLGR